MKATRTILTVALSVFLVSGKSSGVLPLRDQWRRATRLLSEGDPAQAVEVFEEFNEWYGNEPATSDPLFREKWLRLWGLAALQSGATDKGVRLLEDWLKENPAQQAFRAYVRFQLGTAYRRLGDPDGAIRHWSGFLKEHSNLPEAALVHWLWADLELGRSALDGARQHLQAVLEETRLPPRGRALAVAAMAIINLADDRPGQVLHQLNSIAGGEIINLWRARMAPTLTAQLISSNKPQEAVVSSSWFIPGDILMDRTSQLIRDPDEQSRDPRKTIWHNHWQIQLKRLDGGADSNRGDQISLEQLYALRLQALLNSDNAIDARILSEALLASSQKIADALKTRAFTTAIEASHRLQDWETALSLANAFMRDYPDHPDLPEILFLQAKTAAGRKDAGTAIRQIEMLLAKYPDHDLRPGWEMASAQWKLEFGRAAEALSTFEQLEQHSPPSWLPYLKFQQARCLQQINRISEAIQLFIAVAGRPENPNLAEQAFISLLKLHLSRGDKAAFTGMLARYQAEHPNGRHRPIATFLEASLHEMTNRSDLATILYKDLVNDSSELRQPAREALSRIHTAQANTAALQENARKWITQDINEQRAPSTRALEDCVQYQLACRQPALPDGLVANLLEALEMGLSHAPGQQFLEVLGCEWEAYRTYLGYPDSSFEDWVKKRIQQHQATGMWRPYLTYSLHAASMLEREGRHDTADTYRITALTNVQASELEGPALHALAVVADRYDFPESVPLLEAFLCKNKESILIPDAQMRLAKRLRQSGSSRRARLLLQEIQTNWSDAEIFDQALLKLAQWQMEDALPEQAQASLTVLLQRRGLMPELTAHALLLRARADRESGNLERCELTCRRIQALYPAYDEICAESEQLLRSCADA